jgi:hypothetical protein
MIAAAKIHEACFHACVLCLSPAQAYSFLCLSCLCLACYLAACQDTPHGQLAMSLDMHEDQPFIGLVACLGYSCLDCLVSQTLILTMHTCMSHYNDNCCIWYDEASQPIESPCLRHSSGLFVPCASSLEQSTPWHSPKCMLADIAISTCMPSCLQKHLLDNLCGLSSRKPQPPFRTQRAATLTTSSA